MNTASIIKSPLSGVSRVRIGEAASLDTSPAASRSSEHAELEARLHAKYKGEFEGKLEEAREKAREEGQQQGYREGMASGHADGVAAGKDTLRTQLVRLETLLAQAEQSLSSFWNTTASAVEDLTLQAACTLLGEHALSPGVIVGTVRQIMRHLHDADVLKVRLHPAEHARLQEAIHGEDHAIRLRLGRLGDRLVADASLESGGCVVETVRGEYCGTLDVQLARLQQALQARRQAVTGPQAPEDHSSGVACA